MSCYGDSYTSVPIVPRRKRVPVTPAQIIFHRYYPIRISGLHLLDEESLEHFGTVTTGNVKDDVIMQSSLRDAQMTIAGMATLIAEGATFTLQDREAADEIFDVIQQHLNQWAKAVNESFNALDIPMEGLRELETLAQFIYPHAMRHRNATRAESQLYRSLINMVSRRSIVTRAVETNMKGEEAREIEPYQSITDDLTRTLEKRDSSWR